MVSQDVNNVRNLRLVSRQSHRLVDQADAELVNHKLRELREHLVYDHTKYFSPHDPNNGEEDIVSLVVECEPLDILVDGIENHYLL